jgi:hypothetical protein
MEKNFHLTPYKTVLFDTLTTRPTYLLDYILVFLF